MTPAGNREQRNVDSTSASRQGVATGPIYGLGQITVAQVAAAVLNVAAVRARAVHGAGTWVGAAKSLLEADPPYGAQVTFTPNNANAGWHAPPLAPWLSEAVDEASKIYFGPPAGYIGEGGTIPFMGMLGDKFPEAQFVITGVLGPASNAHGPNEFLHIAMGKGVTMAVAHMIHRFQERVCEAR